MPLSAEELVADPKFILAVRFHAGRMRGLFDAGPRLARLLASQQRWLLTQAAYALAMERNPLDASSGLTAVRLASLMTSYKVASRNTVLSFVDELLTYRFIAYEPGAQRRRPRHFEPAEISHQAMFGWLRSNLGALDLLDDGNRGAYLDSRPGLLSFLQPRIARNCIEDARWREPPEQVALFLWNDAGGLITDYLVSRIDLEGADGDRLLVGAVDSRALAMEFMMSRTHLQRLFAKAAQHGFLGWQASPTKPLLWVARTFVEQYCQWQSIKFSYVDEAFSWAKEIENPATTDL
ncbi:hypothetical protein [Rhizobium sp. Root1220]|uniref:hypothetical protein n=1 Tax=Rhizobium sp. Root1220 TaxID=1736432 RepID=UPI0006FCC138|nr:hypothetical protein [Rhizobium sp. Root1220]KQV63854.1 hypothetical protein ASC90_17960 [Rhizobium sp. Root1220]